MKQRSAWERHVVDCSERNSEVYEAHVAAMEESAFTSIADKEQWNFWRKRQASRGN